MAWKRNPILSLVFLTTALFLLLAGKCSADGGGNSPTTSNALSKLCTDVDFPQLCEEIIRGASDAKNATLMAVQALILRATHAKALSVKLSSTATGYVKSKLDTCADVFDDAVDNLQTAVDNIHSGDKGALFSSLSAVINDIVTCDDLIQVGDDDPTAVLGKSNKVLQKLGSNCLALADEIQF